MTLQLTSGGAETALISAAESGTSMFCCIMSSALLTISSSVVRSSGMPGWGFSACNALSMIMMCRLFWACARPTCFSTSARPDAPNSSHPSRSADRDRQRSLVGDRRDPVELFQEIGVVIPAHAARVAVHQFCALQYERAGADTDQRGFDAAARCR